MQASVQRAFSAVSAPGAAGETEPLQNTWEMGDCQTSEALTVLKAVLAKCGGLV